MEAQRKMRLSLLHINVYTPKGFRDIRSRVKFTRRQFERLNSVTIVKEEEKNLEKQLHKARSTHHMAKLFNWFRYIDGIVNCVAFPNLITLHYDLIRKRIHDWGSCGEKEVCSTQDNLSGKFWLIYLSKPRLCLLLLRNNVLVIRNS